MVLSVAAERSTQNLNYWFDEARGAALCLVEADFYVTVRRWVLKCGTVYAERLRPRRPRPSSRWHLDEMVAVIGGQQAAVLRRCAGGDRAITSRWPSHGMATGVLFVVTEPSLWLAVLLFALFLARFAHTFPYATAQNYEVGAAFFSVDSLV